MNPSSILLMLASVHLTLGQSNGKGCSKHIECGSHSACINSRCVDPCLGTCAENAICTVINHNPICRCPPNYTGNPFEVCTTPDHTEVECQPNACGNNIKCKIINGTTICSCLSGYIGDPRSGCRRGCKSNDECGNPGCCLDTHCYPDDTCESYVSIIRVDDSKIDSEHPCDPDPCGYNEICRDFNGDAFCQCRYAPFLRLPESGCNSECNNKFDCLPDKTCINAKCVNSCPGDCSPNDECFVFNHRAKCRSKNSSPECTSNNDCSSDKACDGYKCVDPCLDHCVGNADCRIVNQEPICTCKPGHFKAYGLCFRDGTIVE